MSEIPNFVNGSGKRQHGPVLKAKSVFYMGFASTRRWLERKAANSRRGDLGFRARDFINYLDKYVQYRQHTPDELVELARANPDGEVAALKQFHAKLLQDGLTEGTTAGVVDLMRSFYTFNGELLERRLGIPRPPPRANVVRDWGFSKEELQSILAHLSLRDVAISLMMASSGMSEVDLFGLKWEQLRPYFQIIDGKLILNEKALPAVVHIQRQKTGVSYHTAFSKESLNVLLAYLKTRRNIQNPDTVFVREPRNLEEDYVSNKPLNARLFGKNFLRAARRAGIVSASEGGIATGKTPHRLRNFFDDRMTAAGVSFKLVRYMMGHNLGVANFYINKPWDTVAEIYSKAESENRLTINITITVDKSVETVKDALSIIAERLGVGNAVSKISTNEELNSSQAISALADLIGNAIKGLRS